MKSYTKAFMAHEELRRRSRHVTADFSTREYESMRVRVHKKLERILNWKIAQKSLGQPRVYATTYLCIFLVIIYVLCAIFVRFPVQMSQKSSCTWALRDMKQNSKRMSDFFQIRNSNFIILPRFLDLPFRYPSSFFHRNKRVLPVKKFSPAAMYVVRARGFEKNNSILCIKSALICHRRSDFRVLRSRRIS